MMLDLLTALFLAGTAVQSVKYIASRTHRLYRPSGGLLPTDLDLEVITAIKQSLYKKNFIFGLQDHQDVLPRVGNPPPGLYNDCRNMTEELLLWLNRSKV
jgi:hypothetical protein